jgi:hypothetical protein
MNPNVKKVLQWGAAIGVSGSVVVTVLAFAANAYVAGLVNAKLDSKLSKVPTTIAINAKLTNIEDGIDDNSKAIGELKTSQDEFRLLFIEYLQKEAER